MHLAIKQGQPCPPVHRLTGNTQPLEVSHHIGLHPFQAGAGLRNPFGGYAESDVFGAFNAVVAFGDLIFQHPGKFLPDAVKIIIRLGDVYLVAAPGMGTAVDKGKLERQSAVKVVEERAPAAENRRLILGACHGIIDVLIFHGLCIEPAGELAHPVRVHRQIGDCLLDGQGRPAVTPSGTVFAFCLSQSHPPFSQRPAR